MLYKISRFAIATILQIMSDESIKTKPTGRIVDTNEPSTRNSTNGNKRKDVHNPDSLKNKHPELFQYIPRPGGFHQHLKPHKNISRAHVDGETSRNKSMKKNGGIESHANIREMLETNIRCSSVRPNVPKADRHDDTVRMCSIAISTVMMLAQKTYENITAEHIRHTEEYFRSLKQADGYPRNVGQLVELLTNLKANGSIVTPIFDADEDYPDEEEVEDESDYRGQISDLMN